MKGWAAEAEAALAHQVRNKTEAAYLTTDLFDIGVTQLDGECTWDKPGNLARPTG